MNIWLSVGGTVWVYYGTFRMYTLAGWEISLGCVATPTLCVYSLTTFPVFSLYFVFVD